MVLEQRAGWRPGELATRSWSTTRDPTATTAVAVDWLARYDDGAPLANGHPWYRDGIKPG